MNNQEMITALTNCLECIDKLYDSGVQNAVYKVNAFNAVNEVRKELELVEGNKEKSDESSILAEQ